jgi:drug/metabolite transporter (DMT)-like permease
MNLGASIAAALGAALSFALAALLQQEAAQQVSTEKSLSFRLLTDLLHRAKWLAGIALLLAGFGLQALALANGPVALVQPIVITELAFAIPLAIWRGHHRAGRREWTGIAAVIIGVSLFLWASAPAPGIPDPDNASWLAALIPVALVTTALVLVGATRRDRSRAMLLGAAAGLAFGILAVLTKATTHLLSQDAAGAFGHWQPYVAIAVGIVALVVSQSAYQAGPLAYSMPFIGVLEPLVAVVLGDTLLGEAIELSGASLVLVATSAAVAISGIALLTTSRVVLSVFEERPRPRPLPYEISRPPEPAATKATLGLRSDRQRHERETAPLPQRGPTPA